MRKAEEKNGFGTVGLPVMREADFIRYATKYNKTCTRRFIADLFIIAPNWK